MGRRIELAAAVVLTLVAAWSGTARAQEAAEPASGARANGLAIELNTLAATSSGGCRLTFVVSNRTGAEVPQPRYEFVLFNKDGLVDRLTTFDFGALAEGKTSVRQFDLAGVSCDGLGRILVNGPAQCGDGSAPHCSARLELASRADISLVQ
uniref:hypothetical protein n=1 Tax=Stappia sp. TaxID=1870903 RepID=UPI003BACCD26